MPRPDKRIVPGPNVGAPTVGARAHSWTKYDGPETAERGTAVPSSLEVTVDGITVVTDPDEVSKWDQRGTSAHVVEIEETIPTRIIEIHKEWTVARSIEGRRYRRTDAAEFVEVEIDR